MGFTNWSRSKVPIFCIIAFAAIILCLIYEPQVKMSMLDTFRVSNHQLARFEDYAQNVFLFKEILVKDHYLKSLNEAGTILDFKNGSIEIKSKPSVK